MEKIKSCSCTHLNFFKQYRSNSWCDGCSELLNNSISTAMQRSADDFLSKECNYEIERIYNERMNLMEKKIQSLISENKALLDNSNKVKKEIKKGIDEGIRLLKKREISLCFQVDALYNHQNSLLHEQLFKLYSVLGSYRTTLENLPHLNNYNCLKEELSETSSYAKEMNHFPTQTFKFLPEEDLNLFIQEYGKFVSMEEQNEIFVPMDQEESDEEIETSFGVLKSVASEQVFEKAYFETEKEKCATFLNHSTDSSAAEATPESLLKLALNVQMAEWDTIINPEKPHVAPPCSIDSFEVIMLDKENGTKQKESRFCNCDLPADMDIENLAELSCTTNHSSEKSYNISTWLRQNKIPDDIKHQDKSPYTVPPVKVLCKADGTCDSYSDCICNDNCLTSHLKDQLERMRLSGDTFSKHQMNNTVNQVIQSETQRVDRNVSLLASSLYRSWDVGSWLLSKEAATDLFYPAETKSWLSSSTPCASVQGDAAARDLVKGMFSSYASKDDLSKWLCKPFDGSIFKKC